LAPAGSRSPAARALHQYLRLDVLVAGARDRERQEGVSATTSTPAVRAGTMLPSAEPELT